MTTLYQGELTQTSAANRTDWLYIRSAAILLTSMVCCAFVLRIAVVVTNFPSIAAPSLDHGRFGAEMGWIARSLALGHWFSSPFFPSTGPTALVPPLFPYASTLSIFACIRLPHVWSIHCKIGLCHFVAGQFALGADLYSHLPES
jgi:hypothetical protein